MGEETAGKRNREFNLLVVVKGKERYFFKYGKDQMRALFNALVECGESGGCNLTLPDALFLIRKLKEKQHNTA